MKFPEGKYMWLVNINDKGQIVIPKEARDVFEIEPGSQLILLGDVERGLAIVKNDDMKTFAETILALNKDENNKENKRK
jgi:AbrB family looped-hinge helix DNA binding protein